MTSPSPRKGRRLTGDERGRIAQELATKYRAGASIRELARASGFSIGRVRNLLLEDGVQFRPKGGRAGPRAGR